MRVEIVETEPQNVDVDLLCIGLIEGDELPSTLAGAPGAEDLRTRYRKLTVLRPERPRRVLAVGLGERGEVDAERLRVAAALAVRQARRFELDALAWALPGAGQPDLEAAALVEGTLLAAYRFDRYRGDQDDDADPNGAIGRLALLAPGGRGIALSVEAARVAAEATNRARDLQNLPASVATPTYLAERAEEIAAAHESIEAEVLGRAGIEDLAMGGLAAVSRGSAEEPQLICLRYAGGPDDAETIGLVGKAVTFDSGGISIKPSAGMSEMKMDMSGGAAVIEALAAIAELGLPVNLLAVVPATENMPSGTALKPGDVVTQRNGKTVEVINTDAEGRLILADALSWCVERGADRIVDLATLTGAVVTALGSTYSALLSNDDDWAEAVLAASERSGEPAWRLPLHPEYEALTKGKITDLVNSSAKRKAGTIAAAEFLEEFVDARPWAHLDIAGTSWDVGREYVGKGPTGYGVRLLVELARSLSAG